MSEKITQALAQFEFPNDKPLILAVSGGVDSMVLLHACLSLKNKLVIAHVNHGVREASKQEAAFLKKFADNHQTPFEYTTFSHSPNHNFHNEARHFRLTFFKSIAQKYQTDSILLAHHFDDQVEHFFMHLTHHHNTSLLRGMRPFEPYEDVYLIRPFLNVSKDDLMRYAKAKNVPYVEDESNTSSKYTRNRFRHEILPKFKDENPQFNDAIKSHMENLNSLIMIADEYYRTLLEKHHQDIKIDTFLTWPYYLQKKHVLTMVKNIDSIALISDAQVKDMIKQLQSSQNFKVYLTDSIILHKEYNTFFIEKHEPSLSSSINVTHEQTLNIHENLQLEFSHKKKYHKSSKYFELWYNDKVFPITIRNRSDGDYMYFTYGRKKIKDLLIDLKISPKKRDEIWLITDEKNVLWIPELDIQSHQVQKKHVLYIYAHHLKNLQK